MPEFYKVASVADVPPGQGRVVNVEGVEIALVNVNGHFYAVNNTCAHMGGPLGEGEVNGEVVTCPWHAWRYNVKTGLAPMNPAARVATYEVKVDGNDIKVAF